MISFLWGTRALGVCAIALQAGIFLWERKSKLFLNFVHDEKEIIAGGWKKIVGGVNKVLTHWKKAVWIVPLVALGGALTWNVFAKFLSWYFGQATVHPWIVGITTNALLTGFLTEYLSQKLGKEETPALLKLYRLGYKTLFMFSFFGVFVKGFYGGMGPFPGIDGVVPAHGLWPLAKVGIDQFLWAPVFFTFYPCTITTLYNSLTNTVYFFSFCTINPLDFFVLSHTV